MGPKRLAGYCAALRDARLMLRCWRKPDASLLAERVGLRIGEPSPSPPDDAAPAADGCTITIARRTSLRRQWSEAAAAPASIVQRGSLARREASEDIRRSWSLVAARLAVMPRLRGAVPQRDTRLLESRLRLLKLRLHRVAGDGNCQFRSLAVFLLGSAEKHGVVRSAVVAYLRAAPPRQFAILFASAAAFLAYCDDMAKPATWGDELTLAAAAEAFGVEVHVLHSACAESWHTVYSPSTPSAAGKTKRAFLAFVAPVHYDAIVLA